MRNDWTKEQFDMEAAQGFLAYAASFGSRLGLDCIRELLKRLGDPQDQKPVIHIAGTNGKGSICAFLDACFLAAGYRVGRYNSPTLFTYLERYQINDKNVEEAAFLSACYRVYEQACSMEKEGFLFPTAFEVETAIAFCCFVQEKVDVVLLETGMGGRLDATNVVKQPLATVFASISRDHMAFLGDTLSAIAKEKAGIMREQVPVIISPMAEEARQTLICEAEKNASPYVVCSRVPAAFSFAGTRFSYQEQDYVLHMLGSYQVDNAITALETLRMVEKVLPVSAEARKKGMEQATWRGRFEVLCSHPLILRDGAHNVDAVERLMETLTFYAPGRKFNFVMGVYKDKEVEAMIEKMLPYAAKIYTISSPNEQRRLLASELRDKILVIQKKNQREDPVECEVLPSLKTQIAQWKKTASDDIYVIFGSLSLAILCE